MVGRPIGIAKTGGRKKGVPNRATMRLAQELKELGFSFARELITVYPQLELGAKAKLLSQLMPYLHPQFRTSEAPASEKTESGVINLNTSSLLALLNKTNVIKAAQSASLSSDEGDDE